jgi:DNA-binding NtrC family response regulator
MIEVSSELKSQISAQPPTRVLVVDDAIENLNLLTAILEREGLEVVGAPSAEVALQLAERLELDLAILDILMPGIDGLRLCGMLARRDGGRMPVIFVSGREDAETIVAAFDAGAVDYITKPIQEREVVARVSGHLRVLRLQRELEARNQALLESNRRLVEQIERRERAEAELRSVDERLSSITAAEAARWGLVGFIGAAPRWRETTEEVRRLHAFARTNVLVLGESGSGKELIARAIHYGGARANQPFIAVNCSAIPAELAESTLFGHVRGAFTGATADRKGCFELAHRGSLFLDEIADLPWPLQAKLLRTLEDGSLTPVGATHARKIDVRVICATHADLEQRIRDQAFRQDLYFRLAQYSIHVPALRERREDVPLLVEHFVGQFAEEMKLKRPAIEPDALDALATYDFPGNVRELKNIAERAVISSGGRPITCAHLQPAERIRSRDSQPPPADAGACAGPPLDTLNVQEVKSQLIDRALAASQGNVSAAARLLGVHRSWLYRRK